MIRTRILCFAKLVVRQRNVQGEGVGRVMSRGVYFILQAYTDKLDGSDFTAGDKIRRARPLVGVVCR